MDLQEIKREIARLEGGETTYSTCGKLATLYTVRDGMSKPEPSSYSYAEPPKAPDTEFLQVVSGLPPEEVYSVLDEHFEIIKAIYPKEYLAIIKRLDKIRNDTPY